MKTTLRITLLIALAVASIGCASQSTKAPALQLAAAVSQSIATPTPDAKPAKQVFLCGATTKSGTPCKRHVKAAGLHCYQHQSKGTK